MLASFLIAFVLFVCLPLFQYFNLIGRFCCFSVLFLIFLFQMCSSQRCGANSLPLSLIICSHLLATSSAVLVSKAEGTICTYLAGSKRWKLWALSNRFRHMPVNSFHFAAYLQSLYLMLFTVSTGLNAWQVCRRIVQDRPIS